MKFIRTALITMLLASASALANGQAPSGSGTQGRVASDFMREGRELEPCKTLKGIIGCAQTLVTGQPLHVALGSLAPQNGFAAGLAFVEHKNCPTELEKGSLCPKEFRFSWDIDAVATGNGSWRAGAYMKAFRLSGGTLHAVYGKPVKKTASFFNVAPLFNLYAEAISLNHIDYFGLGPSTLPSGKASYGMTQTIAGISGVFPTRFAGISLYGELNGGVPQIRGDHNESGPSIERLYTDASAPGLASQAAYFQPGEALRIQPNLFADHLRLHYLLEFQQYMAVSDSHATFRRWTADLGHEFPMDSKVRLTAADDHKGPDSCTQNPEDHCPSPTHVSSAINHEGSIDFRLLMTGSVANAHNVVPFYFDPTIGGSDVNGQPVLASFPDYRFRAPNLIMLRETIEHAIPKVPLGVYFSADQAKVGLRRDDIDFSNLRRSYTAGLTIHAGGLPVVYLLFSWGGNEGNHTTFSVSNVLLGSSARPSLF
jgi:hypothetical protein